MLTDFKVFLIRLGLLSLAVAFIFGIFEWNARKMYGPDSDLDLKQRDFQSHAAFLNTLILGASHGAKGINPQQLRRKAYNFAYSGQDLFYTEQLLDWALERAPRVRNVILTLNPFIFGFNEIDLFPHFAKEFLRHFGFVPRAGVTPSLLFRFSRFYSRREHFLRDWWIGTRTERSGYVSKGTPMPDSGTHLLYNGHRLTYQTATHNQLRVQAARMMKQIPRQFRWDLREETKATLSRILNKATHAGLNVYLVTLPYTQHFFEEVPSGFLEGFYQDIAEVLSQHASQQVTFINFSSEHGYPIDLFCNPDHLNAKGAMRFTRELDRAMDRPKQSMEGPFTL